ncbi:nuclear pore complex protein DDB_G0274915-like isoform X2 [Phymastichus coffea]|uniref:nuclear pore complex protein DDB_G0274915-like isoform X2 n=1 Tax=Phymastichus coffea TaxID=108790 RepID=UPI00273B0851|nr:nuclear pore complex protein DDB_G0274915-like isoform X2 [Phymastichus coffea]
MWNGAEGAETGTVNQRGIYLLIGAFLFCVLLYNAWGPLLIVTLALVVVVHTCYSLLVNDSLFAPYTLVLLGHARQIVWELAVTLRLLTVQAIKKFKKLLSYLRTHYNTWSTRQSVVNTVGINIDEDMDSRHRRTYSLSTTGNELMNQVSPIGKDQYHTFTFNGARDIARTSTPLSKGSTWKKDVQPNGDLGLFVHSSTPMIKKQSPTRTENSQPSPSQIRSDESLYGPKGSPWGASSSPKTRNRPTGIKTVQTVAGPLLASTRYNIDPKLYTDISSPGLTSRLTKYAAEASNKLTHQSQYGAGQFPKVNLNASPIPVLSPKVARARIPVTVRIAPPEIVYYSSVDTHQERPNSSPQELEESKSLISIAKSLKKLPLKRHTSREDIMLDLAKKQRFERIFDGELENLEEMMQKRTREESTASDEDGSPQSKNERPLKRSKASSCHDVINSLSSSTSVYTGIKRKAMDTSRCNTPSVEKHFKPSTTSPTRSLSLILPSTRELARSKEQLNVKVPVINKDISPEKPKEKNLEITKPDSPEKSKSKLHNTLNLPTPKVRREIPNIPAAIKPPIKLTDKLFMRAEPQANEKIKYLIEEQGKVEAKFTTDDKEEIKKEDIVNMRQNSMRLRLQSMFDAISGKSSKIDLDVVIQAEEVNPPTTSSYTSLSSQTSTTTVNTSPITTTMVPILKTDTETKSPTNKHVTFNLPSSSSSLSSTASTVSSIATETKPAETKLPTLVPNLNFGSSTSIAPTFNSGSNVTTTASNSAPTSITTSSFSFPTSSSIESSVTSPKTTINTAKTTASSSISTSLFTIKPTETSTSTTSNSTISFGATASKAVTSASTAVSSAALTAGFSIPSTVTKTTESDLSGVSSSTATFGNTLTKSPITMSLTQTTTSLPSFGSSKKEPIFSFGASSSTSSIARATTASQPPAIFGSTTTSSPMFSAGSNNNPPTVYNANNATITTTSTPAATTSMFNFGSTSKSPATFSFGASTAPAATTTATTITPTFVSGTVTATGFGASAATGASNPTVTTLTPTFGTPTPSVFGGKTSAPSLFSSSSSTTTANLIFKSPSAPVTFGAPQPTAITTAATTSIFGGSSNSASFGATPATTSIPSLFGNTAAPAPNTSLFGNALTATTTQPAFGSTQSSSIFSGANATTAGTTSIFGATASSVPSGGLFSGSSLTNQTPVTNPADTSSIFGQAKSPTPISFGGSTSAFGSTTATFPAPNVTSSTSAFGATSPASSSLPAFGSIKSTPQFGTPAATQPSITSPGTSIFGSTSSGNSFGANPVPAFGANSNATPTFGSTTSTGNTFGMPSANSSVPAFGASNTLSFGSATNNVTSPFGATQPVTTTTPSLFGNVAPAGTSTTCASSTFSFGSNQPTQPATAQSTGGSFPFGSTTANAGSSSGVFQFGAASSAAKPVGFNFNAPTAAPQINFTGNTTATPSFNAPAPNFQPPGTNMFSIGSGSSTPRSRTSRARRQR